MKSQFYPREFMFGDLVADLETQDSVASNPPSRTIHEDFEIKYVILHLCPSGRD